MNLLPVLAALLPVGLAVGLAWLVLRAIRPADAGPSADPAAGVRRFLLYGLCYLTLLVAALGVIELADEAFADRSGRSNARLAQALAFLIVGLPAYGALMRYVERRLRGDDAERRSSAWLVYLNGALLTTLIGAMIEGQAVLRGLLTVDPGPAIDGRSLVGLVVWGGLWAAHWFILGRRYRAGRDIGLAAGTVVGIAPLAVGAAGLAHVVGDELYDRITDDPITTRDGLTAGHWASTALVGGVVWAWYWLANYRREERTALWHVTVVPVGALAGLVALLVCLSAAGYTVAVWFFGDPGSLDAARHFEPMPGFAAVALVGAGSLLYHRAVLGPNSARNDAIRSYDYLLAMAALVTAEIGLSILLIAAFGTREAEGVNTLIAGLTMVVVGGPVWYRFWRTIDRHVAADRTAELRSPLRRIYLFFVFGAGGLAVLVAGLVVLSIGLEELLDGVLGRQTLDRARVGLAILVSVTGVAAYHYRVYRSEREGYQASVPMPPPPRPGTVLPRVIVVSRTGEDLSDRLTEAIGTSVVHWRRTDGDSDSGPEATVDVDELRGLIVDRTDPDLLILIDGDEPVVIPFTAPVAPAVGQFA